MHKGVCCKAFLLVEDLALQWVPSKSHSLRKLKLLTSCMNPRGKYLGDWSLYCDAGATLAEPGGAVGLCVVLRRQRRLGRRGGAMKRCAVCFKGDEGALEIVVEVGGIWWTSCQDKRAKGASAARLWICPPWPQLEESCGAVSQSGLVCSL